MIHAHLGVILGGTPCHFSARAFRRTYREGDARASPRHSKPWTMYPTTRISKNHWSTDESCRRGNDADQHSGASAPGADRLEAGEAQRADH